MIKGSDDLERDRCLLKRLVEPPLNQSVWVWICVAESYWQRTDTARSLWAVDKKMQMRFGTVAGQNFTSYLHGFIRFNVGG